MSVALSRKERLRSIRAAASDAKELFDGGPPQRLQRAIGFAAAHDRGVALRALLAGLVAWVPLAPLSALDGLLLGQDRFALFRHDLALHFRLLAAVPLLVLAGSICIPRLGAIARHFDEAGIVPPSDSARFDAIVTSTRVLRDSKAAEIAAILLAYATVAVILRFTPAEALPAWHKVPEGAFPAMSLTGWWHALVSLPLLLMLMLGWFWRLFLWTRLLWRVASLDLQLIPVHPDERAGLAFVGHSLRAFAALGAAFGCIAAGRVAEQVLHHGHLPASFAWLLAGVLAAVAVLFGGPLCIFSRRLLTCWRRGVFEYGALASAVGRGFEQKWLRAPAPAGTDPLDVPDFSATTDLYQIVSNTYRVRLVPVDLTSLALPLVATLLPFGFVMSMIMPFRSILDGVGKLLM